jgi:hypothetical protein
MDDADWAVSIAACRPKIAARRLRTAEDKARKRAQWLREVRDRGKGIFSRPHSLRYDGKSYRLEIRSSKGKGFWIMIDGGAVVYGATESIDGERHQGDRSRGRGRERRERSEAGMRASRVVNNPGSMDGAINLARTDLACFCAMTYPKFELAHHHRLIIDKLEAIERGEINRLMVFMPPRHGKSLTCSTLFPAWFLGRHPDQSIIASSYGQELASDFGRRVRNLVSDGLFQSIFPGARLADDSAAAHRFSLLRGGQYYAVGSGGPITGRGANLLLIDDPTKSAADCEFRYVPTLTSRMV